MTYRLARLCDVRGNCSTPGEFIRTAASVSLEVSPQVVLESHSKRVHRSIGPQACKYEVDWDTWSLWREMGPIE